jgi:hypothetical protein
MPKGAAGHPIKSVRAGEQDRRDIAHNDALTQIIGHYPLVFIDART